MDDLLDSLLAPKEDLLTSSAVWPLVPSKDFLVKVEQKKF